MNKIDQIHIHNAYPLFSIIKVCVRCIATAHVYGCVIVVATMHSFGTLRKEKKSEAQRKKKSFKKHTIMRYACIRKQNGGSHFKKR